MSEDLNKDMSREQAREKLEAIEDKQCFNALDREKVKGMFSWVEITDEQILLNQKVFDLYLKFAIELLEIVPFGLYRDDALRTLATSLHHSLDAITSTE